MVSTLAVANTNRSKPITHAMRLLNCTTLDIEEFVGGWAPLYVILSHTWGDGEVTFQDMLSHSGADKTALEVKAGYRK